MKGMLGIPGRKVGRELEEWQAVLLYLVNYIIVM